MASLRDSVNLQRFLIERVQDELRDISDTLKRGLKTAEADQRGAGAEPAEEGRREGDGEDEPAEALEAGQAEEPGAGPEEQPREMSDGEAALREMINRKLEDKRRKRQEEGGDGEAAGPGSGTARAGEEAVPPGETDEERRQRELNRLLREQGRTAELLDRLMKMTDNLPPERRSEFTTSEVRRKMERLINELADRRRRRGRRLSDATDGSTDPDAPGRDAPDSSA